MPTKALIDTGAEVTFISEEFLKDNEQTFKKYPTLPVSGVAVR